MKAVNLLPAEARHAGEVRLRGANPGTLALLGALVLGVLVVASYVVLSNQVSSKQAELAQANVQVQAAQQQAAKLKHFADLVAKRDAAVQQVTSLADARYDWATVLSRVARALPANTSLTSFDASLGGGSTSAATTTTTTGTASSGGPTISINGCTDSHTAAGRVMERLRAINGVTDVALQSSTLSVGPGQSGLAGCGRKETFALTVSLKPTAAAAATASATTTTTPTTTTAPTTTAPATTAPATSSTPTASATQGGS